LGKDQLGYRWTVLYDLENDPGEAYTVIDTYPDIAHNLRKKLERWEAETSKNPRDFIIKSI
jgi:hypothetical protein